MKGNLAHTVQCTTFYSNWAYIYSIVFGNRSLTLLTKWMHCICNASNIVWILILSERNLFRLTIVLELYEIHERFWKDLYLIKLFAIRNFVLLRVRSALCVFDFVSKWEAVVVQDRNRLGKNLFTQKQLKAVWISNALS